MLRIPYTQTIQFIVEKSVEADIRDILLFYKDDNIDKLQSVEIKFL